MHEHIVATLPEPPALFVITGIMAAGKSTVAQRERDRHKKGYGASSVADFDHVLRDQTPRIGLWLDSSTLSVDQTVDAILARLPEARVSFRL